MGATQTWVMLGERDPREVARPRAGLLPAGVTLVESEVRALDPARREVETGAARLSADHLVVALGAELALDAVPGLAEAAHTFYSLPGAVRLAEALSGFGGGDLVVLIPRAPFKCPPAPYEAALLMHAAFERRGIRARVRLGLWTLEPQPMPTAGPEMGRFIAAELEARGIVLERKRKTIAVDGARHAIRFEDGSEARYDLLVAIPPHRPPRVLVEAGLAEAGGWVAVDPGTLRVTKPGVAPHVYAIGDAAAVPLPGRYEPGTPLVLPKAGVFAAAEGEVVAAHIAAAVLGREAAERFDGRGFCYIETGAGRAAKGMGSFFELPHPVMRSDPPDEAQYRDKLAWVEQWLSARD